MATVKTTVKGQIVIPKELRKRCHIESGSRLKVFEYGGVICLIPEVKDPVDAAWGCLPPKPSLSKKLLEDRKIDFQD